MKEEGGKGRRGGGRRRFVVLRDRSRLITESRVLKYPVITTACSDRTAGFLQLLFVYRCVCVCVCV